MATTAPRGDRVERGRAALAAGGWPAARACFEEALRCSDSAAAWDGLSWACWWLEDGTAAIRAREQAYRRYREAGDRRAAARMAIWLANDHLDFRAEEAVAQGWLRRAARILADLDPAPEHGWLAALEAQFALEAGDLAEAARIGARVRQLGRDLGVTDLEMLGLATEGLALVTEGRLADGMWRLDEAAAAALGGEYAEFAGVAWTCCYVIYACERVRDYDRAAQWCRNVEDYAGRLRIRFLHGVCRVHYAAVLTWHGSWAAADEVLSAAIAELTACRPPFAPEGVVRLAELRRRQGRIEEAERLFRTAEPHPMAAVGMAELALDRDDPGTAVLAAERVLRGLPPANRTLRAAALELVVRAKAAAGDAPGAQAHLDELRSVARAVPTGPLRAAASFCAGVVAAARGEHQSAVVAFEDAVALFAAGDAPYELGRARTELARTLAGLGRREPARREAAAALLILDRVGADTLRGRVGMLLDGLADGRPRGPLTAREQEIVGLIARGMRDGDIAAALSLSRHTIHRHVANIYAKLGCSTRAAAVVKAAELGML